MPDYSILNYYSWEEQGADIVGLPFSKKDDILNAHTSELIELMFQHSTCFSLTAPAYLKQYPHMKRDDTLRNRLQPHMKKTLHVRDWYGWNGSDLEIFVYPCTEETKSILLEGFPSVFPTTTRKKEKARGLEDLCFYRRRKMLFGSLYHEYMAAVFLPDSDEDALSELPEKLEKVGRWKKQVFPMRYDLPE